MIGLIVVLTILFVNFIIITITKYNKIAKKERYEGVKEARKELKGIARKLIKSISVNLEILYEDEELFKSLDIKSGVVFISNHSSNFDIPILMNAVPVDIGFVAKKEMETWPFFGKWMNLSGSIFLDRKNPREGIKGIKKAVEIVKEGHPIIIFPQGTRTAGFGENQFKKGSFKLATEVNGYVVPLILKGSENIQLPGKTAIKTGITVKVYIGNPIKLSQLPEDDLKNINKILEDKIGKIYHML